MTKAVEIVSGRSVNEETKKAMKAVLEKKLGRSLELLVKEDPELLGGVVMKFGTMVVDGSLAERVNDNAQQMKQGLTWKYAAK